MVVYQKMDNTVVQMTTDTKIGGITLTCRFFVGLVGDIGLQCCTCLYVLKRGGVATHIITISFHFVPYT